MVDWPAPSARCVGRRAGGRPAVDDPIRGENDKKPRRQGEQPEGQRVRRGAGDDASRGRTNVFVRRGPGQLPSLESHTPVVAASERFHQGIERWGAREAIRKNGSAVRREQATGAW